MQNEQKKQFGEDIDPRTGNFLRAIDKPLPELAQMPELPRIYGKQEIEAQILEQTKFEQTTRKGVDELKSLLEHKNGNINQVLDVIAKKLGMPNKNEYIKGRLTSGSNIDGSAIPVLAKTYTIRLILASVFGAKYDEDRLQFPIQNLSLLEAYGFSMHNAKHGFGWANAEPFNSDGFDYTSVEWLEVEIENRGRVEEIQQTVTEVGYHDNATGRLRELLDLSRDGNVLGDRRFSVVLGLDHFDNESDFVNAAKSHLKSGGLAIEFSPASVALSFAAIGELEKSGVETIWHDRNFSNEPLYIGRQARVADQS